LGCLTHLTETNGNETVLSRFMLDKVHLFVPYEMKSLYALKPMVMSSFLLDQSSFVWLPYEMKSLCALN